MGKPFFHRAAKRGEAVWRIWWVAGCMRGVFALLRSNTIMINRRSAKACRCAFWPLLRVNALYPARHPAWRAFGACATPPRTGRNRPATAPRLRPVHPASLWRCPATLIGYPRDFAVIVLADLLRSNVCRCVLWRSG